MPTLLAPPPLTEAARPQTLTEIAQRRQDALRDLTPAPPAPGARAPGRPPLLPALCLWRGLLVGVLHGFARCLALWRRLTGLGLWPCPRVAISDQARAARLARAGPGPLERRWAHLSRLLAARLAPWTTPALAPFAAGVEARDAPPLDQVARLRPARRAGPAGAAALRPGTLTGLVARRRQPWARGDYPAEAQQNDPGAARAMVAGLATASLVLADRGYFGVPWFDDRTAAGDRRGRRRRATTSAPASHPLERGGDTLAASIWRGADRADRAKYAGRLVQVRHGGTLAHQVTTVLDPTTVPMAEAARLSARRCDIELAFARVKTHLGVHLLWGAKPVRVRQQVWAGLIIAQGLQALRVEIAGRAGGDPDDVSLPWRVTQRPLVASRRLDPVATSVARGVARRIIRPSARTVIVAPVIDPAALPPAPPHLVLERTPRYAERQCGPRARAAA